MDIRDFYNTYQHHQPGLLCSKREYAVLVPLVEAELGVAFLPEAFLSAADPARVAVPELEQALPPRRICLLARREQPLSAAARELESMIRQAADIR